MFQKMFNSAPLGHTFRRVAEFSVTEPDLEKRSETNAQVHRAHSAHAEGPHVVRKARFSLEESQKLSLS